MTTPVRLSDTVHVSRALPIEPSPGEVGRRIVRHGLADRWTDFTTWAGDIGPAPDAATHLVKRADVLLISPALAPKLRIVHDMAHGGGLDRLETHDRAPFRGPADLTPTDLANLPDRAGSDRRIPIHRGR